MGDWKIIRISCKQCAKEIESKCPLILYQAVLAAAEEEGEDVVFTGTCDECRKDDPFLTLMDKCGIPTLGHNNVSKG